MGDFVIRNPRCPTCGQLAAGTLEDCVGRAELAIDGETGEARYVGYTQFFWNEQKSRRDAEGRRLLVCPDEHIWPWERE